MAESDVRTVCVELLRPFGIERRNDLLEHEAPHESADEIVLHGWDLAQATGQDSTMPDGLAAAAYETIHGRFTEEQRKNVFKPEIPVAPSASPQEKLLAYTGRDPSA